MEVTLFELRIEGENIGKNVENRPNPKNTTNPRYVQKDGIWYEVGR